MNDKTATPTAAREAIVNDIAHVILEALPRSLCAGDQFVRPIAVAVALHLETHGLTLA